MGVGSSHRAVDLLGRVEEPGRTEGRKGEQHSEPWQSRALGEDRSCMAEESEAGEGNERCTSSAAAIVVCSHLKRPRVVVTVVGRLATTTLVSAL